MYFNPRAPCGARRLLRALHQERHRFQSTCPLRGTTLLSSILPVVLEQFQSTCPLRGTTITQRHSAAYGQFQSTCPLRGTTRHCRRGKAGGVFQSTCPLRGTTCTAPTTSLPVMRISIHMPLAGHDVGLILSNQPLQISIHVPLAGHDKHVGYGGARGGGFQSTCPLRGTTARRRWRCFRQRISIHVPLAGHDNP